MTGTATFSTCNRHRFTLTREWDAERPRVCFVMLNPSTADAGTDDPTIRRCIAYARSWGFGALSVVNIASMRATDPAALIEAWRYSGPRDWVEPTRPDNLDAIETEATRSDLVVCAWGANAEHLPGLAGSVMEAIGDAGRSPSALTLTKGGHPGHPLYLRSSLLPRLWADEGGQGGTLHDEAPLPVPNAQTSLPL